MEDFDIFTDQIEFTKPLYKNVLHRLIYESPSTPNGPNYQSGQKLLADECLADNNDAECAFHLSEAISSSMRMMAIYREEQIKAKSNKLQNIISYMKPINDLTKLHSISRTDQKLFDLLSQAEDNTRSSDKLQIEDDSDLPFHKQYLKFSKENNVDNFRRILQELPKEWTIIQLTAPYNPNENLKPMNEYRQEIDAIYLSVFTNDYLDGAEPITINVPANVTKQGEKPLFTELYSILEENYRTIDNAQYLNKKRLVNNYWSHREDIDLRMMSVLNVMDKDWLGGWGSLLTGRLIDITWKAKIIQLVDTAISYGGVIGVTKKQRILLYNLMESCQALTSVQIRTCIRRILTEHGDPANVPQTLQPCRNCAKRSTDVKEQCLRAPSRCCETANQLILVEGIKVFLQVALQVKEGDAWTGLKKAKRHPVILIVDEILDTFPWEALPVLKLQPVSRIDNIHFLYYLYKMHESQMVDGYFETKGDVGRYVINPDKNLDRMEKRMISFIQYWCEGWSGHVAEPPTPADFIDYLTNAHVFLYCGHGDGCHFANGFENGVGVEGGAGAKAVCILSGCGSVRIVHRAGRAPPTGAHRRLHIAGSPMVVGMLWEVTDMEVDKVVTTLLSLYVPSAAPVPWPAVKKAKWSDGELVTAVESKSQFVPERDLLRAIARSRSSSHYLMIASSVVARGLPVRIRET